jgi:hypothetical protein
MALDRRPLVEISGVVIVPPKCDSSFSFANNRSSSRTPAEESRCAYILAAHHEGLPYETARGERGGNDGAPPARVRRGNARRFQMSS